MHPTVDYDTLASTYDQRYLVNDYSGVEREVVAFAGQDHDARVLEVGCGTGHWLGLLADRGGWLAGVDGSIRMLQQVQSRRRLVHGVAEHLPFTTGSCDRLFCVNALHHFTDKAAFVGEARRVLRPGGRMMTIGLDPHTGKDRWYIYDYFEPALQIDRVRYPTTSDIRQRMEEAGFLDCETREVQHLPARLVARTALAQDRLRKGATSQLSVLTDEQYRTGIERIRKDIETAEGRGDVLHLTADLRLYGTFGSVPR
jgi:ubiquinone/menaquinone biosynthesis C-methylase UbiE